MYYNCTLRDILLTHYINVIMSTMASQITSLTLVYSTVYSDADQRKHQSSASLAFGWGIHRDRWIPRTKSQLRVKCFHLMTSSCHLAILSSIIFKQVRFGQLVIAILFRLQILIRTQSPFAFSCFSCLIKDTGEICCHERQHIPGFVFFLISFFLFEVIGWCIWVRDT